MLDLKNERQAHADQRLRSDIIIWLNTVRPDGRPHSVPVWFLWDGSTVLIFSQPDKQKLHNLRQNPNVTLALDNTNGGGDVIVIEGTGALIEGVDTTLDDYVAKYGRHIERLGMKPEQMARSYSQAIRITPTRFASV